jgi:hypothetical protein
MRSRKTLKYFREVDKMDKLLGLLLHWYRLEEALGFPETVSHLTTKAMQSSTNVSQTKAKLPLQGWPKVLSIFYKNTHNYKKDYGLEANTLGAEIMGWWGEVKSAGIRVGGPTGMCSLVVLMCWWCSLLKGRPSHELTDCLRTLDDIDCTISSALCTMAGQPHATPTPGGCSSSVPAITPAPQPRGAKRTASRESLSSRKRMRSAQA